MTQVGRLQDPFYPQKSLPCWFTKLGATLAYGFSNLVGVDGWRRVLMCPGPTMSGSGDILSFISLMAWFLFNYLPEGLSYIPGSCLPHLHAFFIFRYGSFSLDSRREVAVHICSYHPKYAFIKNKRKTFTSGVLSLLMVLVSISFKSYQCFANYEWKARYIYF